jgi:hypothetical protein
MDLEELHRAWLMADVEEEEAYDLYDREDEWFDLEVATLVNNDNMPQTKAISKVQVEQIEKYKNYRELKRLWKRKLKAMGRKKSNYYKEKAKTE